ERRHEKADRAGDLEQAGDIPEPLSDSDRREQLDLHLHAGELQGPREHEHDGGDDGEHPQQNVPHTSLLYSADMNYWPIKNATERFLPAACATRSIPPC